MSRRKNIISASKKKSFNVRIVTFLVIIFMSSQILSIQQNLPLPPGNSIDNSFSDHSDDPILPPPPPLQKIPEPPEKFDINLRTNNLIENEQVSCKCPDGRCFLILSLLHFVPTGGIINNILCIIYDISGYGCCDRVWNSKPLPSTTAETKPPVQLPPNPNLINSPAQIKLSNDLEKNLEENIFANPTECRQRFIQNIYGGEPAKPAEFPWIILIEYEKDNQKRQTNCAGSLLNQRYVLTAAHCVSKKIVADAGRPTHIRLGEYELSSNDVRCDPDGICSEPIVTVKIDNIWIHEDYDEKHDDAHNDIALIRLAERIKYSLSIAPICFPSSLKYSGSKPGTQMTIAGWGETKDAPRSDRMLKIQVPIYNHSECSRKFKEIFNITIAQTQVCAGGIYNEDACVGDSGGPLMIEIENAWIIEGIVSFGKGCGRKDLPGIYTNVSSYEEWIIEKILAYRKSFSNKQD